MHTTSNTLIPSIVIGAAGRGVRMGTLAADKPKHLVHVAGKPWLSFVLHAARRAGFEHMIVVIGYHAAVMRAFLRTLPFSVEIVDQQEQVGDKYGTAAVVESAHAAVGDQPFVFQNGDCLFPADILQQIRVNNGQHALVGICHPNPRQYGVLETDAEGFLLRVIEKPEHPTTDLINAGLYAFQPTIFSAVQRVRISARGEYELTDAVNMLAVEQRVHVTLMTTGDVAHLNTPEDIPQLETVLRQQYPSFVSV